MSVEALTDAELRSKLAEYGYPVGPVTLTTRKILAKKLKNLIEAREAGSKGSRHSLAARYSSDDTDDDTSLVSRKKKSGSARRQTLANPMPPPAPAPAPVPKSPTKRRTPSRSNNHNLSVVSEPYVRLDASDREINKLNTSDGNTSYMSSPTIVGKTVKTVQRKVTKTYKSSSNDGLETGSDSDISNEPEKGYSGSKYNCNGPKVYDSGVSGASGSSSRTSREYSKGDYETPPKPYESKQRSIFTMREESYPPPIFKTSVSPILPVRENNYIRDSSAKDDPLANVETPYLSDFTRRLSRLSSSNLPAVSKTNLPSPILRHSPEVKETDSNGHYSSLRTTYPSSGLSSRYVSPTLDRPREAVTRSFRASTDGKETKNNQNLISMVLVAVVAIFFAVLAVVYLGLGGKAETFPPEHPDNNIPYCSAEVMDGNKPGVNCVLRNSVDTAQQLLKRLQPILVNRAIGFNCEAHDEPPYLTDSDVINIFNKDNLKDWEVKEDLHNAQVLIFKNPKWGISLIEVDEMNKAANQVLESMDQVFMNRLDGKVGMVVPNPDLPLRCLIKNKLYTVLSSLLVVAVGLLGAIGVHKSVVWYFKQKKQAEGEVFRLVSEIISMLELHHQNAAVASPGGTQESYLAINHVRDNLIPPKDRKRMSSVWEKAVVFLDENESRVRREVQQVAGEEFHVWRWLPSNNLNTSSTQVGSPGSKKTKVWQGQAFETMEGSVNSLPCSPTPCLKIRHMFDPDVEFEEDWETKVQDAILEKCGEGVKILHIRVDRGNREGCVYMKCMSQEDAGKAYRALHGWWFDSNLVTVKYLRLERYHERFPDATRCVIPLKPSNNQRLSMQAHYWQSPLETN